MSKCSKNYQSTSVFHLWSQLFERRVEVNDLVCKLCKLWTLLSLIETEVDKWLNCTNDQDDTTDHETGDCSGAVEQMSQYLLKSDANSSDLRFILVTNCSHYQNPNISSPDHMILHRLRSSFWGWLMKWFVLIISRFAICKSK